MDAKKVSDRKRRGALPPGGRLYKRVADELRASIIGGVYPAGRRLPAERELAEMFNVSRPTVREAVIALELQDLVEVRMGAGVFVLEVSAAGVATSAGTELSIGPFELMEARRIIESETAALAATLIDEEQLERLDAIVAQMEEENRLQLQSESADRQFHVAIAESTRNSALAAVIDNLWEIRETSPMMINLMQKARSKGVRPMVDEHRQILVALRARDPEAARAAMHGHLARVIEELLHATETEAIERVRTESAARRRRFRRGT